MAALSRCHLAVSGCCPVLGFVRYMEQANVSNIAVLLDYNRSEALATGEQVYMCYRPLAQSQHGRVDARRLGKCLPD